MAHAFGRRVGNPMLDRFEEKLLEHKKDKFLVVELRGNNGDKLIYLGLEKKLQELNIRYTTMRCEDDSKILIRTFSVIKHLKLLWLMLCKTVCRLTVGKAKIHDSTADVVLICGGGAINDLWCGLHTLKNVIVNNPQATIIVTPHSYWFYKTHFPRLFKNTKQEINLYCRERYSYNLLRSMNLPNNVYVYLSHDLAFYLTKTDFRPINGNYDLICPRQDVESVVNWRVQSSEDSNAIVGDISLFCYFDDFVKLIERSRRVFTDRLHVAILSAILGKETFLFPNYYHKNKGVYELTLHNYPNVKFMDVVKFEYKNGSVDFMGVPFRC